MTENDSEKSAEVVGRYGKEYSRLRRLTSNLDVIQQSVGIHFEKFSKNFNFLLNIIDPAIGMFVYTKPVN